MESVSQGPRSAFSFLPRSVLRADKVRLPILCELRAYGVRYLSVLRVFCAYPAYLQRYNRTFN